MHLQIKVFLKLLILSGFAFIFIIFSNSIAKQSTTDEFITIKKQNSNEIIPKYIKAASHLINLNNFEFLIENKLCEEYKKEFFAILLITSYVGHDQLRAAHRQAISQIKLSELGMQRVFLLGGIPEREHFITQTHLKNEQQRFGDLLQGNFEDAYKNLSYKHIMGLQWSATECKKARFIIKVDDDIVYDIFHVKRYLDNLEFENPKLTSSSELLAGNIFVSSPAIRDNTSKWFVTEQEYSGHMYPPYLSGWFYISNPITALRLVEQSKKSKFFWVDDAWVTGVLRVPLAIPLQNLNSWFTMNTEVLRRCVRDVKTSNIECEYYVGPNGGDSKLLVEFQHSVEKCYYHECVKPTKEKN